MLADGSIVDGLNGAGNGPAGYDLGQLLTGSEGTLAVITAARLRLWPAEPVAAVLFTGVTGIAEAAEFYRRLRGWQPAGCWRRSISTRPGLTWCAGLAGCRTAGVGVGRVPAG